MARTEFVMRISSDKIKNLKSLSKIASDLKKTGAKIVLCHGVFDLVHPGHVRHLNWAKKQGDVLICTITADRFVNKGPGRPYFNQSLRSEFLAALTVVDFVAIIESESAIEVLKNLKPDFYVKGPDYLKRKRYKNIPQKLDTEKSILEKYGGKMLLSDDDVIFSSTKLLNTSLDVYPEATRKYLEEIGKKYSVDDIVQHLEKISKLKILIMGDAIIDQYFYCLPLGKSSKEPIMVHRYVNEETFAGGTLATANHSAAYAGDITLLTLLGDRNTFENFINRNLKKNIKKAFFHNESGNTIVKRRFLDAYTRQKLFQISYIDQELMPQKVEAKILKWLKENIGKFDAVIVNDFGHGMMTSKIIKFVCNKAKLLGINVQANSANYGFNIITKYKRADFICIDEQEIRLATHDQHSEIGRLIKKIYRKMKPRDMIVTRGAYGSNGIFKDVGFIDSPSLTDKVVDRVGAGDALFAMTAPAIASELPRDLVAFVGNVAGALQIQTVGNKNPIEFAVMIKFITRLLK